MISILFICLVPFTDFSIAKMTSGFKLQRLWPRSGVDRMAFGFTMVELIVEGCFEMFIVIPKLYPEMCVGKFLHMAFGIFLFVNTVANFFYAMGTDVTSGSTVLPSILKPGWKYCHTCMHNAPPRAVHCWACECCVLKRDHHCMFTGRCIGHKNLRYYLMAVFYLSLGALYANYLNMDYAMEVLYENLNWKVIIAMVAPLVGWSLGITESLSFFVSFQCGTCMIASVMFTGLLFYHVRLILRGQTTHEWRNNHERVYNLGWKRNLQEALGTRWYLVWISPLVPSPLPGDGIYFRRRDGMIMENIKDL